MNPSYWLDATALLVMCSACLVGGQHLPPGVNPQHYQQQQYGQPVVQQPHMQQQHPSQMNQQYQPQHQPQPQQYQPQHQQQHQQQQQIPQQPMHPQQMHPQGHHDHHGQPQVLNVGNLQQEKEHIAEHLAVPMDTSKMSEQELQFHYFKMHDADNNNKLDGCELIKSLIHWHEQGHTDPSTGAKTPPQEKLFKDDELTSLIDPILQMDDLNSDGYIDYPEFVKAQQKAASQVQQAHP